MNNRRNRVHEILGAVKLLIDARKSDVRHLVKFRRGV